MSGRFRKHGWRLLPGSLATVAIALLLKVGALQSLEQIAYGYLFQTRGTLAWDDRLVVVAIDDASLKQLGRFPLSRAYYTSLLKRLSAANASIVVINLLWSEPSPQDDQLAAAIQQQGTTVLAQAWDVNGIPLLPVPQLEFAAIATGHVMKREDMDGVVRQVQLTLQGQYSLDAAALQAYSFVQEPTPLPPLDQPLHINWVGSAAQLQHYSFVDVIQGAVPAEAFANKIVLVGVTATGMDSLNTPFDRNPPAHGIHLHATVIQNLLHQTHLKVVGQPWLWILLLVGGPGLSWLLSTWPTRHQLIGITGLCCGWGGLALLLIRANYLVPITPPVLLVATTAIAIALYDRLQENYLLRQQVAQLWRHYHHDLVIRSETASHPLVPVQAHKLTQPQDSLSRVTQLAALAEQFGRSQSTQAAIARALAIGLLAADRDGTVWFANPLASQWLNLKTGCQLRHALVPTWITSDQWQSSLSNLHAGNEVKHDNLRYGTQWFMLRFQPFTYKTSTDCTNRGRQPDGFLLLLEDVTDHKRAELELQTAKEIALDAASRSAKANRAKSEFLANMSHELRTPLNIILGFAQVMAHDKSLSGDHQKHLTIINRSGQHLLGLINDVLEMSKIEAGRVQLNTTCFDFHHLLSDLEEMLRVKANAKQLILTVERAPTLPQYITTDEGKLRQVLLNLMGNAIKFTHQGSVTLRVNHQTLLPNLTPDSALSSALVHAAAYTLTFEVEDTGVGIAPDEISTLFHPFTQASAGQQANEGTGLGLAISRKFINLMGGDITVRSTVGQGSLFRFQIQAGQADATNSSTLLIYDNVLTLAIDQPTYRILLVEDQWENSEFLIKLLEPIGFVVREVRNGQECLELWETWQPHLILMDIRMPVMDGYEATRQIRLREQAQRRHNIHPTIAKTKIIALTASVFEETQASMVAIGCDDFLRKPIAKNFLLAKLAEHLGVRYVYEESVERAIASRSAVLLTRDELMLYLAKMPSRWIDQLHQAATKGYDRPILQLIEQIPLEHQFLAKTLLELTHNFQFDELIDLSQPFLEGKN